jgi:hypothetical protein
MKTRKRRSSSDSEKVKNKLESLCKTSGFCLIVGFQTNPIKKFFNNFTDMKYLSDEPIKKIGAKSVNGFVFELHYKRRDYNSYSVMKSTQDTFGADNLSYEYVVGQFVNKLCKVYPCFIETYGFFHYNTVDDFIYCGNTPQISSSEFKKRITHINIPQYKINLDFACQQHTFISVMIQHLKKSIPIVKIFRTYDLQNLQFFIRVHLLPILYQIYLPLSMLRNTFTHYDLHSNNVLLCDLGYSNYIRMHYCSNKKTVSFNTRYISKIIDYGRCFFKDTDANIESKTVHNKLGNIPSCQPKNGYNYGFALLKEALDKNVSSDLWFMDCIKNTVSKNISRMVKKYEGCAHLEPFVKLLTELNIPTAQPESNPKIGYPERINNVYDMQLFLEDALTSETAIKKDERLYTTMTKLGDLYIDAHGVKSMKFVKATNF